MAAPEATGPGGRLPRGVGAAGGGFRSCREPVVPHLRRHEHTGGPALRENLAEVLPPGRTPLFRGELTLLQRSTGRFFQDPEDQALADISDLQGVGGKRSGGKALAKDPTATMAGPKAT